MKPIYLVVGVPASGKSSVCGKLRDAFEYVPHDDYLDGSYVEALLKASEVATKPVLAETPFSISQFMEPLEGEGREVVPVFIVADEGDLHARWDERSNVAESTRRGHLTRQRTYLKRAEELGAFAGSSDEVLEHLKAVVE